MFPEDLTIFLADFGKPVVANGVSGLGIYDAPGRYTSEGVRISDEHMVRCLVSEFGSLLYEDSITVDGQPFTVRDNMPVGDGQFCVIQLTKLDVVSTVTRLITVSGLQITTLSGDYLRIL
jgi:hypothetical protein